MNEGINVSLRFFYAAVRANGGDSVRKWNRRHLVNSRSLTSVKQYTNNPASTLS